MITCYDLDLNLTYIEVDALGHNLTPFSSVKSYAIYVLGLIVDLVVTVLLRPL